MKHLFSLVLVAAFAILAGDLAGFAVPDRKPIGATDTPEYFTNSIGMKFVWIPPGTFLMGSPDSEASRLDEREFQHMVTLTKGFYMGVYTVTQEQWQEVTGENPSTCKGEKNLPVETISWNMCQEFIKKLREKDHKPYRLPWEAEWEYACRAGTTTTFFFGGAISTDQANYNGNYSYVDGKKGMCRFKTTPVGSFPANAFGLHDMHGNVQQHCQDWYGPYPQAHVVDPHGPEEAKAQGPEGARGKKLRVLRGGSWGGSPIACRSAFRDALEPDYGSNNNFGCRVCFSVE
jgi:formylglycine-generating enzyme required for sulfatase activity